MYKLLWHCHLAPLDLLYCTVLYTLTYAQISVSIPECPHVLISLLAPSIEQARWDLWVGLL